MQTRLIHKKHVDERLLFRLRIFRSLYFVSAVGGLSSFSVQLVLLNRGGPYWISPHITGCWICALILFYSLQGLSCLHDKPKQNFYVRRWIAYIVLDIVVFALIVGYLVGSRIDSALWAFWLWLVVLANSWFTQKPRASVEPEQPLFFFQSIQGAETPAYTAGSKCLRFLHFSVRCLAFVFTSLLLGGAYSQAVGYRMYSPDGVFVTISHPSGHEQRILAQCVGPRNTSLPTFWVEVGGGGHSMSDLWGLRDELVNKYHRRYCSYDMPGTGWSDLKLLTQPPITALVMEALREEGPFIMLGSMDSADERILRYALDHPTSVKALVPVIFGPYNEFKMQGLFYGQTQDQMTSNAQDTLLARLMLGNAIGFFGVSWGVIDLVLSNEDYVPQNRARESLFLNLLNEKQWVTNNNYVYVMRQNPPLGNTLWNSEEAQNLSQAIPVFGFTLAQNHSQLLQQCADSGFKADSQDCQYLFYVYNTTLEFNLKVVARNPQSALFACTSCTGSNGFVINQNENIPWFARTLMQAVQHITI